jgi:hypothetical protein
VVRSAQILDRAQAVLQATRAGAPARAAT